MIFGVNTMFFKKIKGKPFGVTLNAAEQKILDAEITRQILENDRKFDMDKEASILWMLHVHFGFGPKRLKKAWELFYAESKALRDHYEMDADDGGWLCMVKLREIGCDLEQWYKEEGSEADAQALGE